MADPKVRLYWHCRTTSGWKRLPAAMGRNGKIRPQYAQVGGAQVLYPEGHYVTRRTVGRKTVWTNVGTDATEALNAQRHAKAAHAARDAGTSLVEKPGRIHLKSKSDEYLQRQIDRGKDCHAVIVKATIAEFLPIIGVDYADQLTEALILRWYAALRKGENSKRTIHNKHVVVFGFLRWAGFETKHLAARAPSYTKKEVQVYTPQELKVFFDSLAHAYHQIVFWVLLQTGLRMQEAMFLGWHNIDFNRGTLTVTEKDDQGFDVKDKEERTLPIPADLVERLRAWKETHGDRRLVLGTRKDTPNWKWLPLLKRLAFLAGLNCGHCKACHEHDECERWRLHKFRATYTTNLLRSGVDVRTVMTYTGHEDMETVLRYLSPAEGSDTQDKINSIVWTR